MSAAKKKKVVKTKSKSKPSKSFGGKERRRFERRMILETFALSAVVDGKGGQRLPIHDLSEMGIGFDYDTEGELISDFPLKEGDKLSIHVFLNRALSIHLDVKVMRIRDRAGVRQVGAELSNKRSTGVKAIIAFLKMLDEIQPMAEISAN